MNSEWLDIAIGVMFVWFVLALAVSAVNEAITRAFAMRSKQLWASLSQILDGRNMPQGVWGGVSKVLLGRNNNPTGQPGESPSPTPADGTDEAPVADVAVADAAVTAPDPTATAATSTSASGTLMTELLYKAPSVQAVETRPKNGVVTRLSHLPPAVFSQALIEVGVGLEGADTEVQKLIDSLPDQLPFKTVLKGLWVSADNDMSKFKTGVESWFDGQMTRLSRHYKRQMRVFLIVIGVIVTITSFAAGFRSDSLALLTDLQRDADLRTALVGTATAASGSNLADLGCPATQTGATATTTEGGVAGCQVVGVTKLKGFSLTLVPADDRPDKQASWVDRLEFLKDPGHWRAWLGLAITAVALSFGASFWFDILRRLIGIRPGAKAS